MAERDFTTIIEGGGQEGPPGSGFPLCEKCGEIARVGEELCPDCKIARRQEAARQELIEEKTRPAELVGLLGEFTLGLNSLCTLLDVSEKYDDVLWVLNPLVERLKADLEKIEAVISRTLGEVKVLVCDHLHMEIDGKDYYAGDFYKAVLEPKDARGCA